MNWIEFSNNVKAWAAERGIYEHSTATAQALKALSELGEVADAVAKNDKEALQDGIGDVAVCIVNWLVLADYDTFSLREHDDLPEAQDSARIVASTASIIGSMIFTGSEYYALEVIANIQDLAVAYNLDFMGCCEYAWEEIKDRKGRMIEGGVFIKEEEA